MWHNLDLVISVCLCTCSDLMHINDILHVLVYSLCRSPPGLSTLWPCSTCLSASLDSVKKMKWWVLHVHPSDSKTAHSITVRLLALINCAFLQVTLVNLVHHMGGTIRKDFDSTKVTHLIARSTHGEKYRVGIHRIHMYTSSLLATDFCV